jgi:hypothetical protein
VNKCSICSVNHIKATCDNTISIRQIQVAVDVSERALPRSAIAKKETGPSEPGMGGVMKPNSWLTPLVCKDGRGRGQQGEVARTRESRGCKIGLDWPRELDGWVGSD